MKSDAKCLGKRLIEHRVTIFIVIFIVVLTLLSIFAGLRKNWLMVCFLWIALASTVFICRGVMISRKIDTYSKYMEKLISEQKPVEYKVYGEAHF